MQVLITPKSLNEISEDAIILPVFEGEDPMQGAVAALDHLAGGQISALFRNGEIEGKRDQWAMLHRPGVFTTHRLLVYGGGRYHPEDGLALQRLAAAAIRLLAERRVRTAAFIVRREFDRAECIQAIVEGALLGEWRNDLYRTPAEPETRIERLALINELPGAPDFSGAVRAGVALAGATNFARRLVDEPSNVMTPTALAEAARAMAEERGLGIEILDEDQLKAGGFGALLAVARGSAEPPRVIVLSYAPADGAEDSELIALVGKGVTFDSGGISIKPAERMDEMKYDMGGGAAVIGAMRAIADLRPKARVLGVIPACENLPSGRSVKPGDVARSLSGKTIEVANTDAEGRLILADALTFAAQRGASCLVDAATLTGACVVALGDIRAGVMGTDQALIDELVSAGEACGERLWQLPFDKEYGDFIRSDIADVRNIGNRTAGAITAGMFLKHFTSDLPWAHIDIAGPAWLEQTRPYMPKGATGFGARLMANFVLRRAGARS